MAPLLLFPLFLTSLGRHARWSLALLATVALMGCAGLPKDVERPVSTALQNPGDTALGQWVEARRMAQKARHPSGFVLLSGPQAAYSSRLALVDAAQKTLDLQYYAIHADASSERLLLSVAAAARRGVRVRLLLDDFHSTGRDALVMRLAFVPNVEMRMFNPLTGARGSPVGRMFSLLGDFSRVQQRMHNKLFIADSAIVVTGGRNIADEYFMRSTTDNFVDMDALVVGAVVPQFVDIFDVYWNSRHVYPASDVIATSLSPEALRRRFDELVDEGEQMMAVPLPPIDVLGYGPVSEDFDSPRLSLVFGQARAFADSPDKVTAATDEEARSMSVTMNVMDRVAAARSEVVLSSPYFVPGVMGVTEFAKLRARDVKVTVLTNSLASNDEPLVHTGYARYRSDLLRHGVDLYELSPTRSQKNKRLMLPGASRGRLHAKTAVIDRQWVFIGSMNLDPRSASRNTELGMLVDSPDLAKEVLRVIHISKLQSAYRLQLGGDGRSLEWLTMDDDAEVVLVTEPDTTFLFRLQNWLLGPFVPEQEL